MVNDERYCKNYPWKATECFGCRKKFKLKKNEKYCNECKGIIKKLPLNMRERISRKEILASEALRMVESTKSDKKIYYDACIDEIDEEKVLEILRILGTSTAENISKNLSISRQTAYKYLGILISKGYVSRQKCGRFFAYTIIP